MRFSIFVFLFLLGVEPASAGGLPYLIGTEASIEAIAQAFASPALPSLDGDGQKLTPMFGVVTITGVDDSGDLPPGTNTSIYNGQVKGNVASLTYASVGKGDFGYFVVFAGTKLTGGSMTAKWSSGTDTVTNISATGYTATAALSYRLIGSEKSIFALGLFAGPAYMSVSATENVVQAGGTPASVSFDGSFHGLYYGLQLELRIADFKLNPYLTSYTDLGDHCRQDLNVQSQLPVTSLCLGGQPGYDIDTTMWGVGINVGYGPFTLNVDSEGNGVHRYLKAKSYALSYGIHF